MKLGICSKNRDCTSRAIYGDPVSRGAHGKCLGSFAVGGIRDIRSKLPWVAAVANLVGVG